MKVANLLASNVFYWNFDIDEWPSVHSDDGSYTRPYNGSILDIRNQYKTVFYEDRFDAIDPDRADAIAS